MRIPKRIMFDSSALLRMHTKRNKSLLEFTLLKFEILISQISVYEYLLAKTFLGRNPEHEIAILKEIYHIVPLDDEILTKSATIMKNLLKSRKKMATTDVFVGVTAIVENCLLITDNPEHYKPLMKYGLDVISTEKFIEELNLLAVGLSKENSQDVPEKSVGGNLNG